MTIWFDHGDRPLERAEALYIGENQLLRWWPSTAIAIALAQAAVGLIGPAVVCAALALVFARLIPWRYAVTPDGIALWFGLGKRRFLPREHVVIHCDRAGATVRAPGSRRFGYPLPERLGAFQHTALWAALTECEFTFTR